MKIKSLNEFYSIGNSIIEETINSENGIKKDILIKIKENLGNNISLETLKSKLDELSEKGTNTGILPDLEYDINKFNFYIKHREEIEDILIENEWLNDNKSKWSKKMEIMDIISEGVEFSIKRTSEILFSKIYN